MNHNSPLIFPTAYFGPVQYFARIAAEDYFIIEQYDHYIRQTYRNRCVILGANGKITLSIPIIKEKNTKTLIKDVRIDYSTSWQRIHKQSIHSAYRNAPYFEFYFDEYEWIYEKKINFLLDLNTRITEKVINQLDLKSKWDFSQEFLPISSPQDFRNLISPKISFEDDLQFLPIRYFQVFSDKFDFVPNLSILDLLLNTGPEAKAILGKSLKSVK